MKPLCRAQLDYASNPADTHGSPCCPHPVRGVGVVGSPDIFVDGQRALRKGDAGRHTVVCGHGDTFVVTSGSRTVYFNDRPAARVGDDTMHCGGPGRLVGPGSSTVLAG